MNYSANQAGIGSKESPNRVRSPSRRAFQAAAFALLSKPVCHPLVHPPYSSIPLSTIGAPPPIANFVNSCAAQAGIGSNESPNRVHSPSRCAFQAAASSLYIPSFSARPAMRYGPLHRASSLGLWGCSIRVSCIRTRSPSCAFKFPPVYQLPKPLKASPAQTDVCCSGNRVSRKLVIPRGANWLLEQDADVVKILAQERQIYQHHLGVDPSQVPTSLFQQALRQDPGLYALAVACTGAKTHNCWPRPFQVKGA